MAENGQAKTPYIDGIVKYIREGRIPLHMPGHKQGRGMSPALKKIFGDEVFKYDITEVDGVDYLHQPTGILKEAQDLAAELYGVDHTFFLINGSTVGNQAAILTMAQRGEEVLVVRNAHRSIYGALILGGIVPVYLQPSYDEDSGITTFASPTQLEEALLKNPFVKGVVLTSPNNYGITAHTGELIKVAHNHNIPVLFDEAHGAHFPFHPCLPPSAIKFNADFVLHSTHKTLSSLTQASLLHITGDRVNIHLLKSYLTILESSSPNCLLMMSLDAARMQMATEGKELLSRAIANAEWLRYELNKIPGLEVYTNINIDNFPNVSTLDPTKVTVKVEGLGLTGYEAKKILGRELGVEVELSDHKNVLLFITTGDDIKNLRKLKDAFEKLALNYKRSGKVKSYPPPPPFPPQIITPKDAIESPSKVVKLCFALGRVAAQMVIPYPPGLPVVSYGEKISQEVIDYIFKLLELKAEVHGLNGDDEGPKIRVVA